MASNKRSYHLLQAGLALNEVNKRRETERLQTLQIAESEALAKMEKAVQSDTLKKMDIERTSKKMTATANELARMESAEEILLSKLEAAQIAKLAHVEEVRTRASKSAGPALEVQQIELPVPTQEIDFPQRDEGFPDEDSSNSRGNKSPPHICYDDDDDDELEIIPDPAIDAEPSGAVAGEDLVFEDDLEAHEENNLEVFNENEESDEKDVSPIMSKFHGIAKLFRDTLVSFFAKITPTSIQQYLYAFPAFVSLLIMMWFVSYQPSYASADSICSIVAIIFALFGVEFPRTINKVVAGSNLKNHVDKINFKVLCPKCKTPYELRQCMAPHPDNPDEMISKKCTVRLYEHLGSNQAGTVCGELLLSSARNSKGQYVVRPHSSQKMMYPGMFYV